MKKDWDPNDFQGRSQRQVENNNKVFGMSIILSLVVITGLLIIYLLSL
jgi:hypothetical protein